MTRLIPGVWESAPHITRDMSLPARMASLEREIGHDEYDPIGTLVLITIYFVLLGLLWLFTYFVEFLGNDPTVVGAVGLASGSLPVILG